MGRVCHGPSLIWAEMSRNPVKQHESNYLFCTNRCPHSHFHLYNSNCIIIALDHWPHTASCLDNIATRNIAKMSRVMRKPAFCICKNKCADQLRVNHAADQRLCFRYIDSKLPLRPKSEISSI